MSEGTPLQRLPKLVEPRKQAHLSAVYSGELPSAELDRLREVVHSIEHLQARLAFLVDEEGYRIVELDINGEVAVICQRCLQPMGHAIAIKSSLAIVYDEDEATQLPSRYDPWIVAEQEGNIYELLEEELLLNLPVVSYHPYDCLDAKLFSYGEDEAKSANADAEKENPFQALAALKDKLTK